MTPGQKSMRLRSFRSELMKVKSLLDLARGKMEAAKADFPAYLQDCVDELNDASNSVHDVIYAVTFEIDEIEELETNQDDSAQ